MDSIEYSVLETRLSYVFKEQQRLLEALTHPSRATFLSKSYQRYEFLGDRVVGLAVSDILFHEYPHMTEGDLSRALAYLVCGEKLAEIAQSIRLQDYIILTAGERRCGAAENTSVLADCMEAVLAAIFLDAGWEAAKKTVRVLWSSHIDLPEKIFAGDPKSRLQQWAQRQGKGIPSYVLLSQEGVDHAPEFLMEVHVPDLDPVSAKGISKKEAERSAAEKMLEQIEQS